MGFLDNQNRLRMLALGRGLGSGLGVASEFPGAQEPDLAAGLPLGAMVPEPGTDGPAEPQITQPEPLPVPEPVQPAPVAPEPSAALQEPKTETYSPDNPYKEIPYTGKAWDVAKYALPLIGLAEVIGSKGRSQGQFQAGLYDKIAGEQQQFRQSRDAWEDMQRKNRLEALNRQKVSDERQRQLDIDNAYKNALDPTTGEIDEKLLMKNLYNAGASKEINDYMKTRALAQWYETKNDLLPKEFGLKEALLEEKKRHALQSERLTQWKAEHPAMNLFTNSLSNSEQQALNTAINNGLDPYKVNSRTARIYAQQEMLNPGRPWNELAANAIFERSQGTMNTKALLNSIDPMLNNLLTTGEALGNSDVPGVNRVTNWIKEQTGDPGIVAFNNLRDDTIAEVERGLLGTGVLSDSKYMRAVKNVNSAQTYPQLRAAVDNMRLVINTRLEALQAGPNAKRVESPAPSSKKHKVWDEKQGKFIEVQ